jgi:aryl-alcohol dehydrogenase-like predicted oxidoreductase
MFSTTVDILIFRTEEIAKKNNLTMAQTTLAWVMAKPSVVAPIVGTTSLKNLEELICTSDLDHSGIEQMLIDFDLSISVG